MSESIQINNETLTFNKVWHVDQLNGSDTIGDGSKNNPYKNLIFTYEKINNNDCIKLINGTHTIPHSYIFDRVTNFTIIGNNKDAHILSGKISSSNDVTIKIYNLIWGYYDRFFNICITNLYIYNCIIYVRDYGTQFSNYLLYSNSGIHEFYNSCLYTLHNSSTLHNYGKTMIIGAIIKMVNCYYKDYYDGTTFYSRSYNINTSLIRDTFINNSSSLSFGDVGNPNIDIDYKITSLGWENTGTGQNPDGSQTHIGVYGGPYAWGQWGVKINSINYNIVGD